MISDKKILQCLRTGIIRVMIDYKKQDFGTKPFNTSRTCNWGTLTVV